MYNVSKYYKGLEERLILWPFSVWISCFLLYVDEKGQEEADGRSDRFRARMWLCGTRAKVKSGEASTFSCSDLAPTCCWNKDSPWPSSLFSEWIDSSASLISLRPSQAAVYNVDEGVRESPLTEANVASVFHQILKDQHDALDHQGNKTGVKLTFQPRSEMNDFYFFFYMKTPYWHFFICVWLQTTELCHLAPSPSSATPQWAVEVAGAPSTAAAATCPALTTHRGRMSRSKRSRSTSPTRDRWAMPPRRAWTCPTLHRRSCPSSSVLFHSDLKYQMRTSGFAGVDHCLLCCWLRSARYPRHFFSLSYTVFSGLQGTLKIL